MSALTLQNLLIEYQKEPIGLDCRHPRFCWELSSDSKNVKQIAYELTVTDETGYLAGTGKVASEESIHLTVPILELKPMTVYQVKVTAWDNYGNEADLVGNFETGRLGHPWNTGWVEPDQEPTHCTLYNKEWSVESTSENYFEHVERDYAEFRPAQFIRIPFHIKTGLKKARAYVTAHGLYRLEVNGVRPDDREFTPENTSYRKILQYQTYDITSLLWEERNVFGIILGDGWWTGRLGFMGDSGQFGETIGLLFEAVLTYEDGTTELVTGESGRSTTGPIIFSDIFVGEKYDARKEINGWGDPDFDDSAWKSVNKVTYPMDNLIGQYGESVRPIKVLKPQSVIHSPGGEMILDMGQVMAGQLEFTIDSPAGVTIKLEHSEVLDTKGNFYNNIVGVNKEQTDFYITKEGKQKYRPTFTYHGFRYVRITGWPGEISTDAFTAYVLASNMEVIGSFTTSNPKINQLQSNIWWSQVSNTLSIPTDCPQRERAGWTGDIMAYSPTMCFNQKAGAFLTRWMNNVRADQLDNGAVPIIVPYLEGYQIFARKVLGTDTSCGWGDAVIQVPLAVYKAYGDKRILEENYDAMIGWMKYIKDRATKCHPEGYADWDEEHKARSKYLWNTDFHFGDWLIPSIVLGNPDAVAMNDTAYATMGIVAPAYYAFSAKSMITVAEALGRKEDAKYYRDLLAKISKAFIEEYVHDDGTLDADFQGIYVICLKNSLVPDEVRPKMIKHLREMIKNNRGCLDTGFLSVLFLMDVLCENDCRDVAYRLLYQTKCPSWLYEVEHGATTMWESWGAIGEDGTVSTYSYNHYAFGCVGDWMYRELGGLQAVAPGYKKMRIAPSLDSGLTSVRVSEHTPYGEAVVDWEIKDGTAAVRVTIPANTTAEVELPGEAIQNIGSGIYSFSCQVIDD